MLRMVRIRVPSIGIALLALTGCEPPPDRTTSPTTQTAATTQPSVGELENLRKFVQETGTPQQPALPPGHPPIEPNMSAMGRPGGTQAPEAKLGYIVPDVWQRVPTASQMRKDQFRLPASEEGVEDGELAVFYFGPGGAGGLEANVMRWRGQFTTAEGQPIPDDQFGRENLEANGLKVTFVEVEGSYNAGSMSMGGPNAAIKPGYQLLGAIVETPAGPWFFKATGPKATLSAQRAAFMQFLQTMKVE